MAKKKHRQKRPSTEPRPQAAQLEAVRRLLDTKEYDQALGKIQALLHQFPDHTKLRIAMIDALSNTEGPAAAGLEAFNWSRRKPNGIAAQQALFELALRLGHLVLADHTARRLAELGVEIQGFPLPDEIARELLRLADGSSAKEEEMLHFDIGKLHMDARDFAGVLHWLDGVPIVPARNNHAIALFHLGRIEEALAGFLEGFRMDADNLFALSWALQMRLFLGDESGAQGLLAPLQATEARRFEDASAKITALLLLNEDQVAKDAFGAASRAQWSEQEEPRSIATLHHLGACAACRLGDEKIARGLWEKAREIDSGLSIAGRNIEAMRASREAFRAPAVLEISQLYPVSFIAELRADSRNPDRLLDALTAADSYLKAAYTNGEEMARNLAAIILKHRAKRGDRQAVAVLRELARLPIGMSEDRVQFLTFLRDEDLVPEDEQFEYWDGQELRTVRTYGTEIHREREDIGLPEETVDLLNRSIEYQMEGNLDEAEALLHGIMEDFPGHHTALGNLAGLRFQQGQREEGMRLLRENVERHPDYLYGRCNLARVLIFDGDIDEADTLLDGLIERKRLHVMDALTLFGTQAMLARAKGEEDVVEKLLESIKQIAEREDEQQGYQEIKGLVNRVRSKPS